MDAFLIDYGLLSKKTKNTFEVKSTHAQNLSSFQRRNFSFEEAESQRIIVLSSVSPEDKSGGLEGGAVRENREGSPHGAPDDPG